MGTHHAGMTGGAIAGMVIADEILGVENPFAKVSPHDTSCVNIAHRDHQAAPAAGAFAGACLIRAHCMNPHAWSLRRVCADLQPEPEAARIV